jgi:hypothetical protein
LGNSKPAKLVTLFQPTAQAAGANMEYTRPGEADGIFTGSEKYFKAVPQLL